MTAQSQKNESTAIQKSTFQLPAPAQRKIDARTFVERMKGFKINLPRIIFPSGKGTTFTIPGEEGQPKSAEILKAVVIDQYPVRAFWREKYSGKGVPPDCSSDDLINGHGDPLGNGENTCHKCENCPNNEWGSDSDQNGKPTDGKACKELHPMFLLFESEEIPYQLTIPPGSLKNAGDFLSQRVLMKGLLPEEVVTEIGTQPAQNKGGTDYRKATFKKLEVLDAETFATVQKLREEFMPLTRNAMILNDDYNIENTSGPVNVTGEAREVPKDENPVSHMKFEPGETPPETM
jgi:hypothetical protein